MISVLITGVGGGGIGEQILKALRLSDLQYEFIGTDTSTVSKGLQEVDFGYVVPAAKEPAYIQALLEICEKHKVAALFPGSEPELQVIGASRQIFAAAGVFLPINPESVIDICLDKSKTMKFLAREGFAFPASYTISSIKDLGQVSTFPCVLKPSVGGGGSANTMIAQSSDELEAFALFLLKIYPEFIVQEYVGSAEQEYTVGVLCDMEGNLINSITIKKNILGGLNNRIKIPNRSDRNDLGSVLAISSGISQGEVVSKSDINATCEMIATRIGATSAINIQCRYYQGKVFVFEINPRYSGTTSLRALVGYNEPDYMLRTHLQGENIPAFFPYRLGNIVRGLKEVLVDSKNVVDLRN
ncbi:hypothetical protein BH24BAC1_BH24BAC1_11550 [soil metagenome]